MEKDATMKMSEHSNYNHRLKYTIYVGDGDTPSFIDVSAALLDEYGSEKYLSKENCIGNIQKQMENNWRKQNRCKGEKIASGCILKEMEDSLMWS